MVAESTGFYFLCHHRTNKKCAHVCSVPSKFLNVYDFGKKMYTSQPYYSSDRPTPFAFRATQKTEREKRCLFSFSQNDNTGVLCVSAAVLFSTEILFTPHTKPRCCHFVRKKKKQRYGVGDGSSDWKSMIAGLPYLC